MTAAIERYKKRIMKKVYAQKKVHPSALKNLTAAEDIDLKARIENARYLVFDTELTGLKTGKDSIVSLGALRMDGGKIGIGDFFYRLIEPRTELTGRSVVIHGITPSEVSHCPDIDTLLPEFLGYCGGRILIGHFVSIDLSFLNIEMKRLYGFPLQNPTVDTHAIYSWMRKSEEKACAYYGGSPEKDDLFSLARKYQIPVNGAHNALSDALITAQLFQRFLSLLPGFGVVTVRDLLRIGRPWKSA